MLTILGAYRNVLFSFLDTLLPCHTLHAFEAAYLALFLVVRCALYHCINTTGPFLNG